MNNNMEDTVVYEFLYNSCVFESAPATMSIHRTRKGAEIALSWHKFETERSYNELYDQVEDYPFKNEYPYDSHQSWSIRETILYD